jgi:molybdenum cofactor cytidylyltransferase
VISAIVLAAGRATRFGSPKVLASLGGTPLVRHVVDRLQRASIDDIVVVVGGEIDDVQQALSGTRARLVVNADPSAGQAESIRVGIQFAHSHAEAILIALGDQPRIDVAVIDQLIIAWRTGRGRIIVPFYNGQRGNPVLFDRSMRGDLMALTGDQGARQLMTTHANVVYRLDIDADAPRDVDTPDDLRELEQDSVGK